MITNLRDSRRALPVMGAVTLLAAVATLAAWSLVGGLERALSPTLAVVIVAAPVALGLAGLLPLLTARRRGRSVGLAALGRDAPAAASRVDVAVLDKHRTVTTGELAVVSVDPLEATHHRNLRWFAGALEYSSAHPIGRAMADPAGRGRVTDLTEHAGLGIHGTVDRHPVRVGEPEWIGMEPRNGYGITVGVEVDERPLGWITVADAVRPGTAEHVTALRGLGIEAVLVSDGTSSDTNRLATEAGIEHVHAEMVPEKRPRIVEELAERGHTVAVVGTAAGNAEAHAVADLPVSDTADESRHKAGIVLDDLQVHHVAAALRLARTTHRVTAVNRTLAAAGHLLALPFAAAGLLSPLFALAVAAGLVLIVGAHSLRVR